MSHMEGDSAARGKIMEPQSTSSDWVQEPSAVGTNSGAARLRRKLCHMAIDWMVWEKQARVGLGAKEGQLRGRLQMTSITPRKP